MRVAFYTMILLSGHSALGAPLTLNEYLEQVRSRSPDARAALADVATAELRMREADQAFSPSAYAEFNRSDSRIQPQNTFTPMQTQDRTWKVGLKDKTKIGTDIDASFTSTHKALLGVNPQFLPYNNFETTQLGLNVTQPLWRDGFGAATRAQADSKRAANRRILLDAKFRVKNLLLSAENTYWSLVSYGDIIKLQEQNVERARRLRDYMKQKVSVRLMDDVDYLQAQSSMESRELELITSRDQREVMVRKFNTLRGAEADQMETLVDLPKGELLLKDAKDPAQRMTREDFRSLFEASTIAENEAKGAQSIIAPQLDLVGSIYANGLGYQAKDAQDDALKGRNPNWAIGLKFSVPLDYRLIGDLRRSYQSARRSAASQAEQAHYAEQRTWDDLMKKHRESQNRFERATAIEATLDQLVKRERQRLLDGRSTTFQTLTFEQTLANAQVARVQAQLALVENHNLVKQFEEIK